MNETLELAAKACDDIAAEHGGKAATMNDFQKKLVLDAATDAAKECAARIRQLKTESAPTGGSALL